MSDKKDSAFDIYLSQESSRNLENNDVMEEDNTMIEDQVDNWKFEFVTKERIFVIFLFQYIKYVFKLNYLS